MTSITGDSNKSSNVTPDKGHRNNLVTSYLLRKDTIDWRETSEPHGSKPFYTGSDNSFTNLSHYEEKFEY